MRTCLDCGCGIEGPRRKLCTECRKARKVACTEEWRRLNPDRVRARNAEAVQRYRSKDPDRARRLLREAGRRWAERNPEKVAAAKRSPRAVAARRAYAEATREERNRRRRESYALDPQKRTADNVAWARKNPERVRLHKRLSQARRKSRLLGSRSPGVTTAQWRAVCEDFMFDGVVYCAYCHRPATQIDHVKPLARGGFDGPNNVAPACIRCNASKNSRLLLWQWLGYGLVSPRLEVACD